jgi:hypothetical protein
MLFVTFHGGKASTSVPCPVNNVYAYDETSNNPAVPFLNILSVPASIELSELRALCFANGLLYVANGSKNVDNVLCLQQSSDTKNPLFVYQNTFVSSSVNSLAHPFSICFDTMNHAYVSSQDTNVVTQLTLSPNFQSGSAVSGNAASYLTPFLKAGEKFLDGTFVASHDVVPSYPNTPKVPDSQGGVDFALSQGAMSHSVRDVVICSGVLCVADEANQKVKMYQLGSGTPGTFLAESAKLPSGPIHLRVQGMILLVAVGASVYTGSPTQSNNQWTLPLVVKNLSPALPDEASGMCFDGNGNFYVAIRKQNEIYQYNSSFENGAVYLKNLPDNPEFVVWQPTAS